MNNEEEQGYEQICVICGRFFVGKGTYGEKCESCKYKEDK